MLDCELSLRLEDEPGELAKILDIFAKNKANLVSISHLREKRVKNLVPVAIKFQSDKKSFEAIVKDLSDSSIEILEKKLNGSTEVGLVQDFILIGHVIDSDIKDTVYKLAGKDVVVKNLDIAIKSLKEPSSVFMELSASDKQSLSVAVKKLKDVAEQKNLMIIEQLT